MVIRLALFQPDIPQNTGTILRLCACFAIEAHLIEPAGFPGSDRAFRRAGMDYLDQVGLTRHASWAAFEAWRRNEKLRLIVFSTRAKTPYLEHAFGAGDVLLFGRESAGVPGDVSPPRMPGLSFPCSRACARSTSRWQRQWRWGRR
jgi:tRNA (cytidine/uridine-2'-O-)-methyltransferase